MDGMRSGRSSAADIIRDISVGSGPSIRSELQVASQSDPMERRRLHRRRSEVATEQVGRPLTGSAGRISDLVDRDRLLKSFELNDPGGILHQAREVLASW